VTCIGETLNKRHLGRSPQPLDHLSVCFQIVQVCCVLFFVLTGLKLTRTDVTPAHARRDRRQRRTGSQLNIPRCSLYTNRITLYCLLVSMSSLPLTLVFQIKCKTTTVSTDNTYYFIVAIMYFV